MADLPLIPWAEVPEGPVWCRYHHARGGTRWKRFVRRGELLLDGDGQERDETAFEFCASEQQPGEWAAERAELLARAWKFDDKPHQLFSFIRQMALKSPDQFTPEIVRLMDEAYEGINGWLKSAAAITRLRDGLAALEQRGYIRHHLDCPSNFPREYPGGVIAPDECACGLDDRLAALREGR